MSTLWQDLTAQDLTDPTTLEGAVQTLLQQFTLEEKVHFMSGSTPFWTGLIDMLSGGYYQHPFPGAQNTRLGIPGVQFIDGPRGLVNGPATCFPVAMARGASFDPALEERVGDAIGVEHRSLGGTLYGGVCVNLLRHPAWGRAQETYGEDTHHLGIMGAALTRGAQRHVMACVKHFALNSMENARFKLDVKISARALHEVYLPHFQHIVDQGVQAVMSAYNSVEGEWAGQSKLLLRDTLKTRWGFDGFVMTDFIFGMRDAGEAARNGQDLEMPFLQQLHGKLEGEVRAGAVPEAALNESVARLLRAQLRQHLRGEPSRYSPEAVGQQAHRSLALEAAQKSIVLLENRERAGIPTLPLEAAGLKRLAVIGRLADLANTGDHGSSDVKGVPYVITPLEGLRAALPDAEIHFDDGSDVARAAHLAAGCDVAVLVLGYTFQDEGEYLTPGMTDPAILALFPPAEDPGFPQMLAQGRAAMAAEGPRGGDRSSLRLKAADELLIQAVSSAQAKTVVALEGGSAILCEGWSDSVAALLMLWYPGMEGGHALADVLLGRVNPGGRLPFSVASSEQHLPPFDAEASQIEYDLWHGYRKLERDGNAPAYPFGYGLSYTEFQYRTLTLERSTVPAGEALKLVVELENVGKHAGDEVVQVYVRYPHSSVERAPRELKAFARVRLEPGEIRSVRLEVDTRTLAHFDESKNDFVLERSTYSLVVGTNALDNALEGEFQVI